MAFNALQFCKDYNIPYALSGKNVGNGYIGINDPFAVYDATFHGGFNPENGTYTSWKTGSHPLVDVISELLHISRKEAQRIIQMYGTVYTSKEDIITKKPFKIVETKPSKIHYDYIASRGFNPKEIIEKYDLRADGYKLIIPIYFKGRIVSYQERDIRYKFYKACPKEKSLMNLKDVLYNIDNCKQDYVLIVEGIFDVYRMGDNCVATLGTSWTKKQASLLTKSFNHAIIMYDPEYEAQKKADNLGSLLEMAGVHVELERDYCSYMDASDPAELTGKQAEAYMRKLQRLYTAV
jgi:hypothetical protein